MSVVVKTIRCPDDYYAFDPSITQKRQVERDRNNFPCNIEPEYGSRCGKILLLTMDYDGGVVAQTLDARGMFYGGYFIQNVGGAYNITLPSLVDFKEVAGQHIGNMTGLQRTAVTVGGSNWPGTEEIFVEFQIRNSTAAIGTVVLNADGLITVSPNTLAAALNVAADTTATFRIYANNLAGTGVAFFIDRV
jgi:hypothetical protein